MAKLMRQNECEAGLGEAQAELVMAAYAADARALQSALDRGALVDGMDAMGSTALGMAIERGRLSIVGILWRLGARSAHGYCPYGLAAKCGRPLALREMLAGRDAQEGWLAKGKMAPSWRGRSPLMMAAAAGCWGSLVQLLPLSDSSDRSDAGETALMLAAKAGSADCIRELLPSSSAIARDDAGLDAFAYACAFEGPTPSARWRCMELLVDRSDLGRAGGDGLTGMERVRERGHEELARRAHARLRSYEAALMQLEARVAALSKGAPEPARQARTARL